MMTGCAVRDDSVDTPCLAIDGGAATGSRPGKTRVHPCRLSACGPWTLYQDGGHFRGRKVSTCCKTRKGTARIRFRYRRLHSEK